MYYLIKKQNFRGFFFFFFNGYILDITTLIFFISDVIANLYWYILFLAVTWALPDTAHDQFCVLSRL